MCWRNGLKTTCWNQLRNSLYLTVYLFTNRLILIVWSLKSQRTFKKCTLNRPFPLIICTCVRLISLYMGWGLLLVSAMSSLTTSWHLMMVYVIAYIVAKVKSCVCVYHRHLKLLLKITTTHAQVAINLGIMKHFLSSWLTFNEYHLPSTRYQETPRVISTLNWDGQNSRCYSTGNCHLEIEYCHRTCRLS